jgi:hypothetical protein
MYNPGEPAPLSESSAPTPDLQRFSASFDISFPPGLNRRSHRNRAIVVAASQCLIKLYETVLHCDGGDFSGAASPVGGRLCDFVV